MSVLQGDGFRIRRASADDAAIAISFVGSRSPGALPPPIAEKPSMMETRVSVS